MYLVHILVSKQLVEENSIDLSSFGSFSQKLYLYLEQCQVKMFLRWNKSDHRNFVTGRNPSLALLGRIQSNVATLYALLGADRENVWVADGGVTAVGLRDGEGVKIGRRAVGVVGENGITGRRGYDHMHGLAVLGGL